MMREPASLGKRCILKVFQPILQKSPFQGYCVSPEYIAKGKPLRRIRGRVPHEEFPSFEQRLKESKKSDPAITNAVNIGLRLQKKHVKWAERIKQLKLNTADDHLEQAARHRTLKIPLDEVTESWKEEHGPFHMKAIAEHYGIYRDLFDHAYFLPVVNLSVTYDFDEEHVTPVFRGNIIPPCEAKSTPHVWYEAEEGSLYTLIMTNPDGHLTDNQAEYLHWAVGNVPTSDLEKGDTLVDYLQPFPPRGTGLHRHVFILFKQEKQIDFTQETRPANCTSLKERTFKTLDFYKKFEDDLTPVGLAFFQSDWDSSVQHVYHHLLNMKQPAFEYDFPKPYHPPLKKYPGKEPFDRYYDRYRDKKDIAEEVLKMKLAMISPYEEYKKPKYPLVHRPKGYRATWLKKRDEMIARRLEQFKDLP